MGSGCIGPAPNGYRGGDQLGGRQYAPAALGSPEGIYAGGGDRLGWALPDHGPRAGGGAAVRVHGDGDPGDHGGRPHRDQRGDAAGRQGHRPGAGGGLRYRQEDQLYGGEGEQRGRAEAGGQARGERNGRAAGQVPGLSILSDSGEPSALSSITLHGSGSLGASSDPLYVLDGIPVAQSTILAMNPSDFERIDILTDASATSIYGSRAANGVIYITTKQGKVAEKATVVARYSFGLSNLASTRYFRQIQGTAEAFDMFEELGTVSPSQLQQLRDRYGDSTFRWYKYRYRDNAPVHNADISVSGGAGRTNYFVSAGYYSSTGLTPMSYYERYNLRANINSKANSWLRLGLNTGLAYDRSRQNPISGGYIEGGLIMTTPPWTRPYKKDGSEYDGSIPNTQLTSTSTMKRIG